MNQTVASPATGTAPALGLSSRGGVLRAAGFLASSFLSSMGDFLLVFSLPNGLGLERNDSRYAVLAWMIPAISVFAASFWHKRVVQRHTSARKDYALLLMGIALFELFVAVLSALYRGPVATLLFACLFLFGYAFGKEGIPRLLYAVSVYRFFVEDKHYSRMAGLSDGLNILAALSGMLVASRIVALGEWRLALMLDALTFVVLAAALWFLGRDLPPPEAAPAPPAGQPAAVEAPTGSAVDWKSLRAIAVAVPMLHAINAVYVNYLPLINQTLSLRTASASIVLIALLRLPGMLSGLFFDRIRALVRPERIVRLQPWLYCGASLLFLLVPGMPSMLLVWLLGGLNGGFYNPADYTLRNQLQGGALVRFNTLVMRGLALFQLAGCLVALYLFSLPQLRLDLAALFVGAFALLALLFGRLLLRPQRLA
ncbi:MAG: MFS transporter [Hyalangium sp.]|uniref:MFS transporter n=1 Tax=Hyalangium sp. TaxID=2028555 RepID=UPI00389A0EE3